MKTCLGILLATLTAIATPARAQDVYIGWLPWPGGEFTTQLAGTLIEVEFGVEVLAIETGPRTLFDGLALGDFDLTLTAALPNEHAELWDEFGDRIAIFGVLYSVQVSGNFERVYIMARQGFQDDYPALADFLIRMHIPAGDLDEAAALAQQIGAEEAALRYIDSHRMRVDYWLTGNVGSTDP